MSIIWHPSCLFLHYYGGAVMQIFNNKQSSYIPTQNIFQTNTSSTKETLSSDDERSNSLTRYDFTNITRHELRETVNQLIKNGEMSLDESSSLVPLMYMNLGQLEGTQNIDYDSQIIDAYTEIKKSLAYNEYSHNDAGILYDNKALRALERFQGKASSLNVHA